jgi:hypothetical protein
MKITHEKRIIISQTGYQYGYGSQPYSRLAYGLTQEERDAARNDSAIVIIMDSRPGDPGGRVGPTVRVVRSRGSEQRLVTRIPDVDLLARLQEMGVKTHA